MTAPLAPADSSRPAAPPSDAGTFVAWTEGIGDSAKSHMVHVGPAGMTWTLGLKPSEEFDRLAAAANARPAEAAALVEGFQGGRRMPRERIARVTYTKDLNQLAVFDDAGKKHAIAGGGNGAQGKIFEAVGRHLGGSPGEEEADAWSVMQGWLFILAVIGVIGGFFIYLTTISDPSYDATGRRSGMKQLVNWLGYTVGPVWMSVIVGAPALLAASLMVYQLVKRPKRQVLDFPRT